MQHMRRHVMEYNVYRWAASILGDLRDLRISNGETPESRRNQPAAVLVESAARRKLA